MTQQIIKPKSIGIIADSSCDLTEALQQTTGIQSIPFHVLVDDKDYIDDGSVDIQELIHEMRASKRGAKSACPSVGNFADAMRAYDTVFVITLSSSLSGSHNAACVARDLVKEASPEKNIYVLDSKSATAGETALGLYVYDLIGEGLDPEIIYERALEYIARYATMFVLIDLDNLFKNGRITKFSKLASSALKLRPIMRADRKGEIELIKTVRGTKNALSKMVDMVKEKTSECADQSIRLVMTYCNCLDQALHVKEQLLERCNALKDVVLVPTGALSSMYANDGGIVISFDA